MLNNENSNQESPKQQRYLGSSNPSFQEREQKALDRYVLIRKILDGQMSVAEVCREEKVSRSTVYRYLKRYRTGHLEGLKRKIRSDAGRSRVLNEEQIHLLVNAKMENYKRNADTLKEILKQKNMGTKAHPSTIRRVLRQHNVGREKRLKSPKVLLPMDFKDPMEVWMGDFSPAIYLPYPTMEGKMQQTHLCLWFDPVTSIVMGGRYYWNANQFNGLCLLKQAMNRFGIPKRLYVDNGELATEQFLRVTASLGIGFSTGRPGHKEGRAHCERMFRTVQEAFESEFKAYPVNTMEELNLRFEAWLERFWYERTEPDGKTLMQLFLETRPANVRFLTGEEQSLFLFQTQRRVKKNSLIQVEGVNFWVDPPLIGRKVDVRYNPYELDKVEIWLEHRRYQIAYPFDPNSMAYRLCRQMSLRPTEQEQSPPVCDFLGNLVKEYEQVKLASGVDEFLQLLEHHLGRVLRPEQKLLAQNYWETHGPFSLDQVDYTLQRFIKKNGTDLHVDYYLQCLNNLPRGK